MMRWIRAGIGGALLAALLHVGFRRTGPLPPLGALLDPVRGVWALGHQPDVPPSITIPSLTDSVRVVFDDRMVPHVFAHNTLDAWRTIGYLHAYYRLFQMEAQVRAGAGTLSEWAPDLLDLDRQARAIGLPWAAERDWAALDTASAGGRAVMAYAEGVNARIQELTPADVPLEYRLLGTTPAPWAPINTLIFAKRMGYTLAYDPSDLAWQRLADAFGADVAEALAPVNAPMQEPIVPTRWPQPRVRDAWRLPEPKDTAGTAGTAGTAERQEDCDPAVLPFCRSAVSAAAASNNWAVLGARTASGHPVLAGDPHLDLTLPSIWYELHLVVPDTLDVYGVSFPGSPLIPIGFNRDVAWSFTNTGADVLDWWDEVLDDPAAPEAYRLDGEWHRLERRMEVYRGPGGHVLAEDTLYFTHRGPLRRAEGHARSMRWTVLEPQGILESFLPMLHAHTAVEWLSAMANYRAPAQNGIVADRGGNVAIVSAGAYPIRPDGGDGRTIRDGTTSSSDWMGYLPTSSWPYARNPAQGYLASANQQPIDPQADPVYLGADWEAPWRAMRINALLRADTAVTPDAMRRYQTDPGSARVDWFMS